MCFVSSYAIFKVKGFGKIGKDNFDLFIKNDLSLCRSYPAALIIKDLTVVKVRSHVTHMQLLKFARNIHIHYV